MAATGAVYREVLTQVCGVPAYVGCSVQEPAQRVRQGPHGVEAVGDAFVGGGLGGGELDVARTATPEMKEVTELVVTADLATPGAARAVADAAMAWAPEGLDLLVNNAGGIARGGHDPGHLSVP